MNFDKIVSKKSFMEQLANRGIDALGGVNEVLDIIDASRPFNTKIRKEYFCRRKNEIKDLASCTVMTTTSNCINELDKKIEKTYFSALESLPNSK
jgi:poly(A) polymerase Pap1